jgi:hypothetical protein
LVVVLLSDIRPAGLTEDPPESTQGYTVTKLTGTKINLINHNRENTKNNLIAVNMNNTSTTQIKINSCRTTQVRQPNNRSKHWIIIARNKRNI